jgi:signal transduction histidine kinase
MHWNMRHVSQRRKLFSESSRLRKALATSEERLRDTLSELEATRRQIAEAGALKDRSLASLVHELRVPLTPILLTAQSLEEDLALSPQQRQQAAMIRRNAELETRLVGDLLDLTRISHGKLELLLNEIEVDRKLCEALAGFNAEIGEKRIAIVLRLQAADHRVCADPLRLHQVFWNLFHNAVKFTPAGGQILIRSKNPGPRRLVVEIADTGIGIEPDLLPFIFHPFEQGDRQVTRKFGGLGLGLAVSKNLVEAHGGTLTARSEGRGRGAVFTLELPLAAPAVGSV